MVIDGHPSNADMGGASQRILADPTHQGEGQINLPSYWRLGFRARICKKIGATSVSSSAGSALATSGLTRGSPKALNNQPRFDDEFDPSAQCPMNARNTEGLGCPALFLRQILKPEGLDPPIGRIKIVTHLDRARRAIGLIPALSLLFSRDLTLCLWGLAGWSVVPR